MPHLFLSFTTAVRSWRPKFEHRPATYHRVRNQIDASLADEGARMTCAATSVKWGPFRACVVWP